MATFLIWMSPEAGHILPTIKLARNLIGRGHRVVYLAYGGFAEDLRALGFEVEVFFVDYPESVELPRRSLFASCSSAYSLYLHLENSMKPHRGIAEAICDEIERAANNISADAVLIDGIKEWRWTLYEKLMKRWKIIKLCVHFRTLSSSEVESSRRDLVFLCPEALELPGFVNHAARYAESCPFTDFPQSSAGDELFRQPLVYVSFGSQIDEYPSAANAFRQIIEASRSLIGVTFAVNAGRLATNLDVKHRENVILGGELPHLTAVRSSLVVISHGGLGSVKDCIYGLKPMLILPQKWDQHMNARRVRHHRLGMALEQDRWTSSDIARSLAALISNEQHTAGLKNMRERFVEEDASQTASKICELLLK